MKTHKSLMVSCLSVLSITLLFSMHKLLLHLTQMVLGCWVIGTEQRTALQAQGYDFLLDIPVNMPVF